MALSPVGARAQLAWDSPLLVHPHAPHGWSLLLADPYPGRDVAVMASWRTAAMPVGFGVRLGLGEGVDGDLALFGGADASGELIRRSADIPFDVVWVVGGGASLSDDVLVSLPAGLVAGWSLDAGEVVFQPYVGPRVVLDAWIGGREPGEGDDLQLEATVDLGFDLRLAGGWTVRFGATIGDREALAVGLALPATGRR
jgi:hypothetical protein